MHPILRMTACSRSESTSKPLINLLRGWPHLSLLPCTLLLPATTSALTSSSISAAGLFYGPDDGYPPLREQIAQLLTNFYSPKEPVSSDRICITGGASQSLACLLQVFTDPIFTRNVWMVAPTYFLACRIFEDAGFAGRLRAVPEDEEGVNVEVLGMLMAESEDRASREGNLESVLIHAALFSSYYSNGYILTPSSPLVEIEATRPWRKSTPTSSMRSQPSPTPRLE
jgi:DNA-binding transcriptional MocR family regulator